VNIFEFTILIWLGSLVVGFWGSLTGLGGRVVIVPLLALALGVDIRYAIGASLASVIATRNACTSGGSSSDFERNEATADFSIPYGLPGKPGCHYTRPFDYFEFQLTTSGNAINPVNVENLMTRGLLLGKEYEAGNSYRGIWGLCGSYD
jgi:hypothetical protein